MEVVNILNPTWKGCGERHGLGGVESLTQSSYICIRGGWVGVGGYIDLVWLI